MKKKILYTLATIIVALASFVYGRYDITWGYTVHEDGTEDSFETPHLTSYKAIAERNVESTCILMDIIDDIYVKDKPYFLNHIYINNPGYQKLIGFYNKYEGLDTWEWEDMYNY